MLIIDKQLILKLFLIFINNFKVFSFIVIDYNNTMLNLWELNYIKQYWLENVYSTKIYNNIIHGKKSIIQKK